ncbi:hypothetical protein [Methanovulcanius yangii]|nr:hypothetical protein [Methanovulcanius yangii]
MIYIHSVLCEPDEQGFWHNRTMPVNRFPEAVVGRDSLIMDHLLLEMNS